jgi:hypothetical protein
MELVETIIDISICVNVEENLPNSGSGMKVELTDTICDEHHKLDP